MSDEEVLVEDKSQDSAILLLAAAEELGLDPGVVRSVDEGFLVPKEVHDAATKPKKTPAKKSN